MGTGFVPELCTKSSDLISTTGRKMKHLLFKSSKCHFKADQDKVQGQFGLYCQKDNACENKMIGKMNFLATKEDRKISYKSSAM